MNYRKAIYIILCAALLIGTAIPGTLSMSIDSETQEIAITLEPENNAPEQAEETAAPPESEQPSETEAPAEEAEEAEPVPELPTEEPSQADEAAVQTAPLRIEWNGHTDLCAPCCHTADCGCGCHRMGLYQRALICESYAEYLAVMENAGREALDGLTAEQLAELNAYAEALNTEAPQGPEPPAEESCTQSQPSLFERLMAAESEGEMLELMGSVSEAEARTLTEEEIAQLQEHLTALYLRSYTPPETVSFTQAGPFLPPVDVRQG